MKKLFAIVAVMGALTFGSTQLAQAQDIWLNSIGSGPGRSCC